MPKPPPILVSGVFVAGSVGLQIGTRYLIALDDERLVVSSSPGGDPQTVVFERPVWEMDATGLNDRLILSQREDIRGSSVMAFIGLVGGSPASVVEAVKYWHLQVEAASRE